MTRHYATNGRCIVSFKGTRNGNCYTVQPDTVFAEFGDAEWVDSELPTTFVMEWEQCRNAVMKTRKCQVELAELRLEQAHEALIEVVNLPPF